MSAYKPPTDWDRKKQSVDEWVRRHQLEILLIIYVVSAALWRAAFYVRFGQ